ncbi:hypothetical protein Xcel_3398 (plasmid) [Xylanimonas cellulosilytica DSM 15894]|uniref:Uncharacterized protein n=1 Tax=Xylanimonas cellulosilytica (strain DSM 15894 / JCM 12276 / CECT 5975 / KCTC 9989 / LMG 20990 / NBRC 107835 / XIL07) TaxID=446471 RepID=D1C0T1_XYLCX|nr:hypothetical protein [Xylanimonas cellulosilytica]ACZ32397.1 hypothetical protein Xcel_3398 [Xylanimonas cellulosilytica DSM 15894]
MNVLTAAWTSTGKVSGDTTTARTRGKCARCATTADLIPVRDVISKAFTGFDGWTDPTGRGLCAACAWGYSTPALRAVPHLVSRDPAQLRELSRTAAGEVLASGPLDVDQALVVPLRPGRKHLLPTAGWGRVTVDDAQLPWTEREVTLLRTVTELRDLGFGSRMLTEPAPPYQVMSKLPPASWSLVLRAWDELAVWRVTAGPWMPLALHLTIPTTKDAS